MDDETRPWLIQVDGMSKNFRRAGGIRIGWSVAPEDLTSAMVNLQSHYTAEPSLPTQHAALAALTHAYDPELRQELEHERGLLYKEVKALPQVRVWPTSATFYSFWDVRDVLGMRTPDGRVLHSSDDVAQCLVHAAGVVTASGCGFMQDGYLRVSLATPDEHIVEGIRAAAEALRQLVG